MGFNSMIIKTSPTARHGARMRLACADDKTDKAGSATPGGLDMDRVHYADHTLLEKKI